MDMTTFIQIIALIMLVWILGISTVMFIVLLKGYALKPNGFTNKTSQVISNQTDMSSVKRTELRADEIEDSFEEEYMPTAFDKRIEQMAEELRDTDLSRDIPLYDLPNNDYNPSIYSDVEIITEEFEKVMESKYK